MGTDFSTDSPTPTWCHGEETFSLSLPDGIMNMQLPPFRLVGESIEVFVGLAVDEPDFSSLLSANTRFAKYKEGEDAPIQTPIGNNTAAMLGVLELRNHAKWVEALNNPKYFVWYRPLHITDEALNPGFQVIPRGRGGQVRATYQGMAYSRQGGQEMKRSSTVWASTWKHNYWVKVGLGDKDEMNSGRGHGRELFQAFCDLFKQFFKGSKHWDLLCQAVCKSVQRTNNRAKTKGYFYTGELLEDTKYDTDDNDISDMHLDQSELLQAYNDSLVTCSARKTAGTKTKPKTKRKSPASSREPSLKRRRTASSTESSVSSEVVSNPLKVDYPGEHKVTSLKVKHEDVLRSREDIDTLERLNDLLDDANSCLTTFRLQKLFTGIPTIKDTDAATETILQRLVTLFKTAVVPSDKREELTVQRLKKAYRQARREHCDLDVTEVFESELHIELQNMVFERQEERPEGRRPYQGPASFDGSVLVRTPASSSTNTNTNTLYRAESDSLEAVAASPHEEVRQTLSPFSQSCVDLAIMINEYHNKGTLPEWFYGLRNLRQ